MAKISDVAAEAGVSVATVSRVLNGKTNVDAELAGRVRAASLKLAYRPNGVARSLRRQSSDVIALIINDVARELAAVLRVRLIDEPPLLHRRGIHG